jgi:hypothetical protein
MMIQIIHPEQTLGTSFSPVAQIAVPLQVFMDRGFEFARDVDDLDAYDYAGFMVEGRGMAMFQRYCNESEEMTNLFLSDDFRGLSSLAEVLRDLSEGLGIPGPAFRWRQDGQDLSLAPSSRSVA